jgi:hypothetical protein
LITTWMVAGIVWSTETTIEVHITQNCLLKNRRIRIVARSLLFLKNMI